MAFILNGLGTRYQGTRWLPDGTYITTKWFVFVDVPIVPLGSVRITQSSAVYGSAAFSGQSLKTQKVPLDIGMVLRTYAWIVGAVGVLVLLAVVYNIGESLLRVSK
jgi:hypothetical protein